MSTTIDIRGVPIQFPFTPYNIQKDYMEKVIESLQNESTAVLESPTGTGKTLCLLCSSLAWLQLKKAQLQAQKRMPIVHLKEQKNEFLDQITAELQEKAGQLATGRSFLGLPTIIYASRTHSQLTQAMQELKRSSYSHMKASVLGSRDQLCIHPEVMAEQDQGLRIQMCRMKLLSRSCHFYNRMERLKDDPKITDNSIIDIEDMVKLGGKHKFCPYYMTKDLQQKADVIFTPYNYLLDPIARKALGLNLANSVIILDEAHNVERVCEESASIECKSSDIALAIEEVTAIMKLVVEVATSFEDSPKDIDPDELATFKEMLLNFEKVLDEIPINSDDEMNNFPGDYIFDILEKANITSGNCNPIIGMIDKITQFLTTKNDGPFARKGKALQLFSDFLAIVFASKATREKVKWCYKVHIKEEKAAKGKKQLSSWLSKGSPPKCRILSFWCFSPGFGMDFILSNNIKALILTSGTLAPLKPFISELELNVKVSLENPHIVGPNQICVKILSCGPDGEPLNSSYQNRDNPKYISSLGRAIVNFSRIIPDGLLIFFPTYPVMHKCQSAWQEEGIWSSISNNKAIFVEPREKDAFNAAMTGYYEKIRDPNLKGAIFMAVCKGKVSEGLDFSDANGRAVIITGLPYPPLKDPRVILKRRYLDQCHAKDKEYLTGQDWYSLEASRAVNQAIGRVIRHRFDYGAILLLDQRFNNFKIKEQMSKWIRGHIKVANKFGEVVRDLSQFFRKAQTELPDPNIKPSTSTNTTAATFETQSYRKGNFDFSSSSISLSSSESENSLVLSNPGCSDNLLNLYTSKAQSSGLVTIHNNKRINQEVLTNQTKRKKIILIPKHSLKTPEQPIDPKLSMAEYVTMVKDKLGPNFRDFADELNTYRSTNDIDKFLEKVDPLVPTNLKYIFIGMDKYIRKVHQDTFRDFLRRKNLTIPEDL